LKRQDMMIKVSFDLMWIFFDYNFAGSKIRRSDFSICLRTFAWLGELPPKFRLIVARTRRKFGDISRKTKREIRRNLFSLLYFCTVLYKQENYSGFNRIQTDNLSDTLQTHYNLSYMKPCYWQYELAIQCVWIVNICVWIVNICV